MDEQDIQKDIDTYSAISSVASSKGGELLIESLTDEISIIIGKMTRNYADMTLPQFMAAAAGIEARLKLMQTLTRSKRNEDGAREALKKLKE